MPIRFYPLMPSTISGTIPPVIYDPDLELYLSFVEQRYSFYIGHRKIQGPQRWLSVSDNLPSNIVGHPIGGIDYVIKRIAFKSNYTNGTLTFKLFNDDVEIYNFNITNNQTTLHIDNINLVVLNLVDLSLSISTDYSNNVDDYVDFPAVSIFARRVFEDPPGI